MKYEADMGSLKIVFTDKENHPTGACFWSNGDGDGEYSVFIKKQEPLNGKFQGHFTVIQKAYIAQYDCNLEVLRKLKKGRYFVYLDKKNTIYLVRTDLEIEC